MGYAFISYSSHQQRQLEQVKEYLHTNGLSYWAAPDDIPIGAKYSEVIKRAIANASCVLFLLSERSQSSTYCKLEIALALKLEKPIVPIQLEDVILNDDFSLFLSSSEFYPLPGKRMTAKTNKLLNQLKLLCTDPEQGTVEPADPSYKIGWFRKGTWLQLAGWIWMIGGFDFFQAFADLCFPKPGQYGNHPIDWWNGPLVVETYFKGGILVTLLMLLGLLTVCYGFSLNRKLRGEERLYFRQFSLCQIFLLISCGIFGVSVPMSLIVVEHYYSAGSEIGNAVCLASLGMLFGTLLFWICRQIRRLWYRHRSKMK